MKLNLDCVPCFQRQALQAIRFVTDDEEVQGALLRKVVRTLEEMEWDATPPEIARQVHRLVRRELGREDPYRQVKRQSNEEALALLPRMRELVEAAEDPIVTAARLAIAGNIIDFGAVQQYDLKSTIDKVLSSTFAKDDTEGFKAELAKASSLLYFLDNAGEVAFDRLFVETILSRSRIGRIDFVLKGGPIINDATIDDAVLVGLDRIPNASFLEITNGDPGTGPARRSDEVRSWIREHDIVISKGQGNYEEMSDYRGLYFLFLTKCAVVARDIGVDVGSIVFHRSG
jgi:uncharacterized protein with ATP-grasp and redox domains